VPAAAVIPAPVAYVNIAAVKKLVVECVRGRGATLGQQWPAATRPDASQRARPCPRSGATRKEAPVVALFREGPSVAERPVATPAVREGARITLKKLECPKQAVVPE